MVAIIFQCPHTGLAVQAWFPDDDSEGAAEGTYLATKCLACTGTHLVNPATGKVLGVEKE